MSDGDEILKERLRRGWSQAELAEQARRFVDERDRSKLVQQVVDRVESGRQSKYRNAVLQALELPLVVMSISDSQSSHITPFATKFYEHLTSDENMSVGMASALANLTKYGVKDAPEFAKLIGPRDVEELGVAVGGKDGDFELNGETISRQPRPPGLMSRDVFAVRVQNDSMYPRFKDGELVYVERKREPAVGEDAIIEMVPTELLSPGRAFIKEIARKTPQHIIVKQHNPKRAVTFRRSEIKALYRVVPWNECFGV